MSDHESIVDKLRRAHAESGLGGVGRRAGRVTLDRLADRFQGWSTRLLHAEAWARLPAEHADLVERNSDLHGIHRSRPAFIIGNGPSLKDQDLSPLAGELTFAVNAFWKHPIINTWQPTYYFLHDSLFFDGSDSATAFFESMVERAATSTFFIPVQYHELAAPGGVLPVDRTRFLAIDGYLSRGELDTVRLDRIVPSPPTSLQTGMLAAIAMGCNPIYLLGADHSWLNQYGTNVQIAHFYDDKTLSNLKDPRSYRPDYLRMMEYVESVWHAHITLADVARRAGVDIFNVTDGSVLDVFPRKRYEDVIRA